MLASTVFPNAPARAEAPTTAILCGCSRRVSCSRLYTPVRRYSICPARLTFLEPPAYSPVIARQVANDKPLATSTPNKHKGWDMSSLFDLTGKVAIVTGSTKGIGLAIATRMAEHGAT